MRALTGRESSALALLAQSLSLSKEDKEKVLSILKGDALVVGQILAGVPTARKPSQAHLKGADGFKKWAKDCGDKNGRN